MALTLPVTLVAGVTAAVTYRPGLPSVIDVVLTAATLPPIASRSAWPEPGVGIAPLPGWSRFPVPPPGAAPPGALPLGVTPGAVGEAFAAAGLAVWSRSTAVTTANPAAAATSAVAASAATRRPRR